MTYEQIQSTNALSTINKSLEKAIKNIEEEKKKKSNLIEDQREALSFLLYADEKINRPIHPHSLIKNKIPPLPKPKQLDKFQFDESILDKSSLEHHLIDQDKHLIFLQHNGYDLYEFKIGGDQSYEFHKFEDGKVVKSFYCRRDNKVESHTINHADNTFNVESASDPSIQESQNHIGFQSQCLDLDIDKLLDFTSKTYEGDDANGKLLTEVKRTGGTDGNFAVLKVNPENSHVQEDLKHSDGVYEHRVFKSIEDVALGKYVEVYVQYPDRNKHYRKNINNKECELIIYTTGSFLYREREPGGTLFFQYQYNKSDSPDSSDIVTIRRYDPVMGLLGDPEQIDVEKHLNLEDVAQYMMDGNHLSSHPNYYNVITNALAQDFTQPTSTEPVPTVAMETSPSLNIGTSHHGKDFLEPDTTSSTSVGPSMQEVGPTDGTGYWKPFGTGFGAGAAAVVAARLGCQACKKRCRSEQSTEKEKKILLQMPKGDAQSGKKPIGTPLYGEGGIAAFIGQNSP